MEDGVNRVVISEGEEQELMCLRMSKWKPFEWKSSINGTSISEKAEAHRKAWKQGLS